MKTCLFLLVAVVLGIMIFGTPIAIWMECKSALENRRFLRILASRESLSDAEFIRAYYADAAIPADIPLRLRPIYGQYFEIDPPKIDPEDLPASIHEFDTRPLVDEIENEFGIEISDEDQERTTGDFDSVVRMIARLYPTGGDNLRKSLRI